MHSAHIHIKRERNVFSNIAIADTIIKEGKWERMIYLSTCMWIIIGIFDSKNGWKKNGEKIVEKELCVFTFVVERNDSDEREQSKHSFY